MQNKINEKEIVVGIHSIAEALKNPLRSHVALYATDKSLPDLKKRGAVTEADLKRVDVKYLSSQKLQDIGRKFYMDLGHTYQRIASNLFLLTSPTVVHEPSWLVQQLKESKSDAKILCLDNVTDIQNIAAIMRTMAFFEVKTLILSQRRGGIKITPTATRIASGALEHVNLVACSNLSRLIGTLEDNGVTCVGLSEHSKSEELEQSCQGQKLCLIMGAEDTGLSHAVERKLKQTMSLKALGPIKSLNVSVASALAMNKFFGQV